MTSSLKTGTLTWHFNNNYGSVLQAYALQYALTHYLNINNRIIDYHPVVKRGGIFGVIDVAFDLVQKKGIVETVKRTVKYLSNKITGNSNNTIDISKIYDEFRTDNFKLSQNQYYSTEELISAIDEFDCYITGSDNIWITNPDTGQPYGLSNSNYYLHFVPESKRRIAYAASMGDPVVNGSGIKNFSNLFGHLDFISVREKTTAEFISALTHRDVAWVVDPTLLLTANDWKALSGSTGKELAKIPYILVYVIYPLDESAPIFLFANYLRDKLNLRIINIGYHKENGKISNDYVSVPDFLSYIENAEFIITNSFHGTAFSINFRKSFVAFPPREGACRITDLLSSFRLADRYVSSLIDAKNLTLKIDYNKINCLINERREYSLNWLKMALLTEKEDNNEYNN